MGSLDFESGYNWKKLNSYRDWVGAPCWKDGTKKESEFGELLKTIYTDVRPATTQEQYDHKDWVCSVGSIDVKAIKGVSRHGKKNPNRIWIEFKNTLGNYGWVYGKQDFIAFEQVDCYIMVRRKDLAQLAESLCDMNTKVGTPKEALYKLYNRKNSRDLISMIKTEDLLTLQHRKINK